MAVQFLYVGHRRKGPASWSAPDAGAYGIGIYRYDDATGTLDRIGTVAPELSVGALFHDPSRDVLYAMHEAMTLPGYARGGGGLVVAFSCDRRTGALTELCGAPSYGSLPCFATQDRAREHLLVVHHTGHTPITRTRDIAGGGVEIVLDYDEAATVVLPLDADGTIGAPVAVHRHTAVGALAAQTHSQLHSINRVPDDDLFLVCDKGGDRIDMLHFSREAGLSLRHSVQAPAGSSPRYAAFHPELPLVYVNFETKAVVQTYRYDKAGTLTLVETLPLVPEGRASGGAIMASDLVLDADHRRLYVFARGIEAVILFDLLPDGALRFREVYSLGVENARGGALAPRADRLFTAAAVSGEVKYFDLDAEGGLADAGRSFPAPHAGCLLFVEAEEPDEAGARP